ncbi:hypothetical protein CSKR_201504 [Clonorchis sinensis]|uniref:Uncharacterized protein n=1 Tax=Clonorchis sinensis TaxID=79923 RepID=A0A8T1MS92_CLOSI|nr:hypothetical protein CSKR_201504 [Clonorchis sinensis]
MKNDELHYPILDELEPAQTTTYPDQDVGCAVRDERGPGQPGRRITRPEDQHLKLTAQQFTLPHSSQRQLEVQPHLARPSNLMHLGETMSMSTPQLATGNRVSKTSLKMLLASMASTSKIYSILDSQTENKAERIYARDRKFGQEEKPKERTSTSSHSKSTKVDIVDNFTDTTYGMRNRITKKRYTTMRKGNQPRVYEIYGMPHIQQKRVNRDPKRQTLREAYLVRRKPLGGSRWASERGGKDQSLANFGFRYRIPPKSDRRKRYYYSSSEHYSTPSQHSLRSDLSSTISSRTSGKNTFKQRKADSVHALGPPFSTYSRLPLNRDKAYYREETSASPGSYTKVREEGENRGRTTYRIRPALQNLGLMQQEKKRMHLAGRGRSTGSHRVNQRVGFRDRDRSALRKAGSDIERFEEYVKSDSISIEEYPSIVERSFTSVQSPLSISSTSLHKTRAKTRSLSEERGRSGAQVHQTSEDRIGFDAPKDRDSINYSLKESNGITDEQDCKHKSHETDEHSQGTLNRRSHQSIGLMMVKARQVGKDQLTDHPRSSKHREDTVMDHCVDDLTLQDLELFSEQESRTSDLKKQKYSPAERISVISPARSITELSYGSLNLRPEYTSEHHIATASGEKSGKHNTTKNLPPFIQREITGHQRESSENRERTTEISHENVTVKAVNSKDMLEYAKQETGTGSENQLSPRNQSEAATEGKDRRPKRQRGREKNSTGEHEKHKDQAQEKSYLGQKDKPNTSAQSVTSETPPPDRITGQPTSSDVPSRSTHLNNRPDDGITAPEQRSDAQVREMFIYYPEERSRPLANSIESRLEENPAQTLLHLETATMVVPSAGEHGVMGTPEDGMGARISPYDIGEPDAHPSRHVVMESFGGERAVSDSLRPTVPEDKHPGLADSVKPTVSAQSVTSETPPPDRITGQPKSVDAHSTSPHHDNSVDRDLAVFSACSNVGKYSANVFRVTSRFLDGVPVVVDPQGVSFCVFELLNSADSVDVLEEYEPTLFDENGLLVIADSDISESISVSYGFVLLCQDVPRLVLCEIKEPILGYIFAPSQLEMFEEEESKSGVDRIPSTDILFTPCVSVLVIDSNSHVPDLHGRFTDPEKSVPSFVKHQLDSAKLKQGPVCQSAVHDGENIALFPQQSLVPGRRFRTDELPNDPLSLNILLHDRNHDTLYLPVSEYNLLIEQMPNESRDFEKELKASHHGLQDSSLVSVDADISHACNIVSHTDVKANHGTDALYGLDEDAQAQSVPLPLSNEHHSFRAEQINLSPSTVDRSELPPQKPSGVKTLRTAKVLGGKRAVDQTEMSNQAKSLTDSSCQATPPTDDQLAYPVSNLFTSSTGIIPSSMHPVSPDQATNSPQAIPSRKNPSFQSIDDSLAFLCLPNACALIFEQPMGESVCNTVQFEPILLTPFFNVPVLLDQLQLLVAYPFEIQPVHSVSPFDLLYEVVPVETTTHGTTWRQETFGPQTIGKSRPGEFIPHEPSERASLLPEKVATTNEVEVDGSMGDPKRDQAVDDRISSPVQKTSYATARHPQYSLSSCPLTPHHERLIGSLNNLPDSHAIVETNSVFEALKETSLVSHSKSRSVDQATSKRVPTSTFAVNSGPTENQKDPLSLTVVDRLHSAISIVADVIREVHANMGTDQNCERNKCKPLAVACRLLRAAAVLISRYL